MTIVTGYVSTRLVIQPDRFWVRFLQYYSRIFGLMLEVSFSINFYARIYYIVLLRWITLVIYSSVLVQWRKHTWWRSLNWERWLVEHKNNRECHLKIRSGSNLRGFPRELNFACARALYRPIHIILLWSLLRERRLRVCAVGKLTVKMTYLSWKTG